MKQKFGLIKRPWGVYYMKDKTTGTQTSLKTSDKAEAIRLLNARNEAEVQPQMNIHLARIYMAGANGSLASRTWQNALDAIIEMKIGSTKERWLCASREKALDLIRSKPIVETQAEHFFAVLKAGTVSTNVHLRKLHNFCINMGWLLAPVLPKQLWPAIHYKEKRAISHEEHLAILDAEKNPELHAFYELCWHLGGAQSDVACLLAENINWQERIIVFRRKKTKTPSVLYFGEEVAQILGRLPTEGFLFPRLARLHEKYRAKEFNRRCKILGIKGVSLHSYRYAWAQRAKVCGYPERFAQEALGHNSKAVHRAYARGAQVKLPALEDYEKAHAATNIIPLDLQAAVFQEAPKPKVEPVRSAQATQSTLGEDTDLDVCAI